MPPLPPDTTILQVLPALDGGGVERGTIEIAEAIVRARGRALVASAGGRMVPALERIGAVHLTLPLMTKDPVNILLNARRLRRAIGAEGVSLVHARSRAPAWSAWSAARATGTPFVTTWHGIYGRAFPGKRAYNAIMGRGDRVIAISRVVAEHMMVRYHVPEERIRLVPRGVDFAVFDTAAPGLGARVHALSEAWRLPPGVPVVMLPGRLTRWKGAEVLLRAAAMLGPAEFVLVLAGDAQGRTRYLATLQALAEELGLAGRLRLAGHCDDMPAALTLADVVVCPSTKPEAFGRAVIEAQAMARPVIASSGGGAGETIAHGETGWHVTPADPGALAERLRAVLDMPPGARREFGARARADVAGRYTKDAMQWQTLDVYRELLHPGSG